MSRLFQSDWRFSKPWRSYQARVLEELGTALADGKLHVVAAPGSGKTVLGLELVRRLARPALALSPTITVREQWVQRLVSDFLPVQPAGTPRWISREILEPGAFTVSTYQALSSAFKKPEGRARLKGALEKIGLGVLVLDEAHHLRGHWWTCLERLQEDFPDLLIVSLTATPPYDVPQGEWNRYARLCGPVDAEISAPELVLEGNLCPHQDYVYFCEPLPSELDAVTRFAQHRDVVLRELRSSVEAAECLAMHPLFRCGLPPEKEILSQLDWFLATALYLREVGGRVPPRLVEALGIRGVDLPDLDLNWLQVFLQGLLFERHREMDWYPPLQPHLRSFRRLLNDAGAIEKGRVIFQNSQANRRLLAASPSKISAVSEIIDSEFQEIRGQLRAVVLADSIRDELLEVPELPGRTFEKLGVVPIFEALRRRRLPGILPAVLTGRLVIVPKTALAQLKTAFPPSADLKERELEQDREFRIVAVDDANRHQIVRAVTEVFESGEINVLVGTAALLGEGWDAPATNTLILASSIGSFMTSNQMRGRAIRTDPQDADKAANIWHLACVAGDVPGPGTSDLKALSRRFSTYAGVSLRGDPQEILEGIGRMGLPEESSGAGLIAENSSTFRAASDRFGLRQRWKRALPPGQGGLRFRPIREVVVRTPSIALKVGTRSGWFGQFPWSGFFQRRRHQRLLRTRSHQLRAYALTVLRTLEMHRPFSESISDSQLRVKSSGRDHQISLSVDSAIDQRRFAKALEELFEILRHPAPRYLLRSKGRWFALPSEIHGHRNLANAFLIGWRARIGQAQLFYVHGKQGRAALLEAKRDALLGRFEWEGASRTRWRTEENSD